MLGNLISIANKIFESKRISEKELREALTEIDKWFDEDKKRKVLEEGRLKIKREYRRFRGGYKYDLFLFHNIQAGLLDKIKINIYRADALLQMQKVTIIKNIKGELTIKNALNIPISHFNDKVSYRVELVNA